MRGFFLDEDSNNQKQQNQYNQGNMNYQQTQSTYQQNSSNSQSVMSSNLYPNLPDISQLQKETFMNKMTQQVVKNYTGWGEEKPKNDALGETKFVEQIGIGISKINIKKLGGTQHNAQQQGGGYGNQNSEQNPYNLWDIAAQNIQNTGQNNQFQFNPNQQNQNYQNQSYSNQYGQGYSNNMQGGQGAQGQNQSLWDTAFKNFSFHINPIFEQGIKQHKFPSPFTRYKIIPYLDQKKVLDVTSVNEPKKGLKKNSLIIWDFHGGPNQLFYIKQQKNGLCYIVSIAKGFVVKLPERMQKQDDPMVVNPKTGNNSEMWRLDQTDLGCYQIVNGASGLALDLYHQKSDNGTPVIQWKKSGRRNQKWRIVPA